MEARIRAYIQTGDPAMLEGTGYEALHKTIMYDARMAEEERMAQIDQTAEQALAQAEIHTKQRRTDLRTRIGQAIYTTVEKGPMSFVADGGETAVLLAELAIRYVEEAGWVAPE